MPRVPLSLVPGVSVQPRSGVQLDAPQVAPRQDVTGEQIQQTGAALGKAGEALVSIQDSLDTADVTQGDNRFSDAIDRVLYAPDQGFAYSVGQQAVEGRQQALDEIAAERRRIEETLKNPRQRMKFGHAADARMQRAQRTIDSHAGEQVHALNQGTADAAVMASARDWVRAAIEGDGEKTAVLKATALQRINRASDLRGIPKDSPLRSEAILKATTAVHGEILDQILNSEAPGAVARAQEHLDAAIKNGEIDKLQEPELQGKVKRASRDDRARKLALDSVQEALRGQQTGIVPLAARLDFEAAAIAARNAINSKFDSGTIDAVEAHLALSIVDQEMAAQREAQAAGDASAMRRARQALINDPTMSAMDVPRADRERLELAGLLPDLIAFGNSNNRGATDPNARALVRTLADSGALARLSPSELDTLFLSRLSPSDMDWAHGLRLQSLHQEMSQQQKYAADRDKLIIDYAVRGGQLPTHEPPTAHNDLAGREEWLRREVEWTGEFERRMALEHVSGTSRDMRQVLAEMAASKVLSIGEFKRRMALEHVSGTSRDMRQVLAEMAASKVLSQGQEVSVFSLPEERAGDISILRASVSPEMMQAAINSVLPEGSRPPVPAAPIAVSRIPPRQRELLELELIRAGRDVTPANIVARWLAQGRPGDLSLTPAYERLFADIEGGLSPAQHALEEARRAGVIPGYLLPDQLPSPATWKGKR